MTQKKPMQIDCLKCGASLRWTCDLAGRKVQCKFCGNVQIMPLQQPTETTPPPSAKQTFSVVQGGFALSLTPPPQPPGPSAPPAPPGPSAPPQPQAPSGPQVLPKDQTPSSSPVELPGHSGGLPPLREPGEPGGAGKSGSPLSASSPPSSLPSDSSGEPSDLLALREGDDDPLPLTPVQPPAEGAVLPTMSDSSSTGSPVVESVEEEPPLVILEESEALDRLDEPNAPNIANRSPSRHPDDHSDSESPEEHNTLEIVGIPDTLDTTKCVVEDSGGAGVSGGVTPYQSFENSPLSSVDKEDSEADDDIYELAEPVSPPAPVALPVSTDGSCPSCHVAMNPGAVICVSCGYNIQLGRKVQGLDGGATGDPMTDAPKRNTPLQILQRNAEDEAYLQNQARRQDLYFPLGLIGFSAFLLLLTLVLIYPTKNVTVPWMTATTSSTPSSPGAPAFQSLRPSLGASAPTTPGSTGTSVAPGTPGSTGTTLNPAARTSVSPLMLRLALAVKCAVGIAIKVPFLFVGMLLTARLFGVSFGNLTTALLKLFALVITAQATDFFVEAIISIISEGLPLLGLDFYIRFPFVVVTFFGLAMKMFGLDVIETVVLFLSTYLLPVFASIFCLMGIYTMMT